MKKRIVIWSTLGVLAMLTIGSALVWADEDQAKEEQALLSAKVSLNQAIDQTLATVPGIAISAELDDNLTPPAYVVEVLDHGQTYKVTLNAQNGQIIDKKIDRQDEEEHDQEKEDRD